LNGDFLLTETLSPAKTSEELQRTRIEHLSDINSPYKVLVYTGRDSGE